MKITRVSDLIYGVFKFENWNTLKAKEGGKRLHAKLLEKYHKRRGNHCEKQLSIFLVSNSKKPKLEHLLTGTPDMWYVKKDTLYIIDHKTFKYPNKITTKREFWDQLFGYLLLIYINHGSRLKKVKHISLQIWGYHRYKTTAESMEIKEKLTQNISLSVFKEQFPQWINDQFKGNYLFISPSSFNISLPR